MYGYRKRRDGKTGGAVSETNRCGCDGYRPAVPKRCGDDPNGMFQNQLWRTSQFSSGLWSGGQCHSKPELYIDKRTGRTAVTEKTDCFYWSCRSTGHGTGTQWDRRRGTVYHRWFQTERTECGNDTVDGTGRSHHSGRNRWFLCLVSGTGADSADSGDQRGRGDGSESPVT